MEVDKVKDYLQSAGIAGAGSAAMNYLLAGANRQRTDALIGGAAGVLGGAVAAAIDRANTLRDIENARAIVGVGRGSTFIEARRELKRNMERSSRSMAEDKNPRLKGFEISQFNA